MGYDYGPQFRGLRRIKTNDFASLQGEVEWTGKWVTFVDCLLQTMAIAMPFRKLMVPVMIRQMRCDPNTLYEAVAAYKSEDIVQEENGLEEENTMEKIQDELDTNEKNYTEIFEENNVSTIGKLNGQDFHVYKSILPFYIDMNTRMIVAPGVEIEDLIALPIPRMVNIQDLKLESYEFIDNEEYNAIEECDKNSLLEYLKVCSKILI